MPNRSRKKVINRDLQMMEIPLVYIYMCFVQFTQQRKREQKKKEECMLNKMHNARK